MLASLGFCGGRPVVIMSSEFDSLCQSSFDLNSVAPLINFRTGFCNGVVTPKSAKEGPTARIRTSFGPAIDNEATDQLPLTRGDEAAGGDVREMILRRLLRRRGKNR